MPTAAHQAAIELKNPLRRDVASCSLGCPIRMMCTASGDVRNALITITHDVVL